MRAKRLKGEQIVLILRFVTEGDWFHPKLSAAVWGERDCPRGVSGELVNGFALDGLTVHAQGDATTREQEQERQQPVYGWQVRYEDLYAVDRESAERMARTLRKIDKSVSDSTKRLGRPESFGAYAVRVADALDAQVVIKYEDMSVTYSENRWKVFRSEEAQDFINSRIAMWQRGEAFKPRSIR